MEDIVLGSVNRKIPKLLSPVKTLDGAIRVIGAGADEIYCDVTKPEIKDFTLYRGTLSEIASYDELDKIVKYAHDHNAKVFITVNLPYTIDSIEGPIKKHIYSCVEKEVDGLIIGDLGLLSLIKDMRLRLLLVASSYTESTNHEAVAFLEKQGFKRVILERHLTIDEIAEIVKHSNIEIEIMIHGSGCSNINGNCYLFHYVFPGMIQAFSEISDLKYPCTIRYEVYDVDNKQSMIEDNRILDAYTFCSLCRLPQLVDIGVSGFKIVGRELNEEYQERTVRLYRELLNLIQQGQMDVFNERIENIKEEFMPFPPSLPSVKEFFCEYNRCYYGPLFNTPYRFPPSWKIWTKFRFRQMVFERENSSTSR